VRQTVRAHCHIQLPKTAAPRGSTVEYNNAATDWAERLRANRPSFKQLTLNDVAAMSARREIDGWYVALCDGKWTVGRRSRDQHYPVVLGSEALTFESKAKAERYLRALLIPTGVEHEWILRIPLNIAEAMPYSG
jgi:hypothetical protein